MRLRDLDLPIVNDGWHLALEGRSAHAVHGHFAEAWQEAVRSQPPHLTAAVSRLLWLLEAWLGITGQEIPAQTVEAAFPTYEARVQELLAAIYSTRFAGWSFGYRVRLAELLIVTHSKIATFLKVVPSLPYTATKEADCPVLARRVAKVEDVEINIFEAIEWRGWVCRRKANSIRLTYLPLTPVKQRLGVDFTFKLYELCRTFVSTRRGAEARGARCLAEYVGRQDESICVEQLQNATFTDELFRRLYKFYLETGHKSGSGSTVARLVALWRGEVTLFFENYVFPSGLIARPASGMPIPRNLSTSGHTTNVVETDAGLLHCKLLTPVPLHVSDDEAMALICDQVTFDLDRLKQWAWSEVCGMAELLARRKRLAEEGTPRKIGPLGSNGKNGVIGSTEWGHPDHIKNAAATFEEYGYPYRTKGSAMSSLLFPYPRKKWAEELAMPTPTKLVAHCAVIVGEHPQITAAFLEQLVLFDKSGRLCGISGTDGGTILSGAKLRKGPSLAAQDIILNDRSAFALNQIRLLTEPLRDFLKARGDDAWRYLLISSGPAFGYPRRMRRLAVCTSAPDFIEALTRSFEEVLSITRSEAETIAKNFSLTAMRASAGVAEYFKTKSVQDLATTLGHVKYDIQQIDRYLPRAIREFFEERWIRIFQTGVILQALEGSKYRLAASGFASIEELDAFLRKHALQLPRHDLNDGRLTIAPNIDSSSREVIFGLNEEILTTLLSLQMALSAGKALLPKAKYWAEVAAELIPYIRHAGAARPDIQWYLERAQRNATQQLIEKIAYAQ